MKASDLESIDLPNFTAIVQGKDVKPLALWQKEFLEHFKQGKDMNMNEHKIVLEDTNILDSGEHERSWQRYLDKLGTRHPDAAYQKAETKRQRRIERNKRIAG